MNTYDVTCTKIYNGTIRVEAESQEEAMQYAQEHLDQVDFDFGEITVDYADEV